MCILGGLLMLFTAVATAIHWYWARTLELVRFFREREMPTTLYRLRQRLSSYLNSRVRGGRREFLFPAAKLRLGVTFTRSEETPVGCISIILPARRPRVGRRNRAA